MLRKTAGILNRPSKETLQDRKTSLGKEESGVEDFKPGTCLGEENTSVGKTLRCRRKASERAEDTTRGRLG